MLVEAVVTTHPHPHPFPSNPLQIPNPHPTHTHTGVDTIGTATPEPLKPMFPFLLLTQGFSPRQE